MAHGGPLTDWGPFAASWSDLGPDPYLEQVGRMRRRRHAVFSVQADGSFALEPRQPHFQSLAYNRLQGDLERWFEPLADAAASSASLAAILRFGAACFGPMAPEVRSWKVEVHQFRIEATLDHAGEPTPEGVHRDGVDYVLVLLVARHNIARGTTTVHTPDGRTLGEFTLTVPLDTALVDDARVLHGVTPVTPLDPSAPAYRDVLVVTYRRI